VEDADQRITARIASASALETRGDSQPGFMDSAKVDVVLYFSISLCGPSRFAVLLETEVCMVFSCEVGWKECKRNQPC